MANTSKGLGKGLAALLGDDVIQAQEEKSSLYLPISQVESCASQPRKQFDPHCDFSSTYYLDESGRLICMTQFHQNDCDTEQTDFVEKTNKYTDKRWRIQDGAEEKAKTSPLMKFALRTLTHSFSISGKGFQDVWNIDLGRLRGCCVHMITGDGDVVPFCAFHLTSETGERLYHN